MLTVHRVTGQPEVTCVSSGPVTIILDGPGPFSLTAEEWAALQSTAAAPSFAVEE